MNYFLGIDAVDRRRSSPTSRTPRTAATTRSRARPSSRATSGITRPRSTTRRPTPGGCTSTARSTARSRSAATSRRESTSIQHAAIGSALTSTGAAAGFFQGSVDEVRIWNVARSTAQIQATEDLEVASRHRPDRPLRPERGHRLDRRLERRRRARRARVVGGATWASGRAARGRLHAAGRPDRPERDRRRRLDRAHLDGERARSTSRATTSIARRRRPCRPPARRSTARLRCATATLHRHDRDAGHDLPLRRHRRGLRRTTSRWRRPSASAQASGSGDQPGRAAERLEPVRDVRRSAGR